MSYTWKTGGAGAVIALVMGSAFAASAQEVGQTGGVHCYRCVNQRNIAQRAVSAGKIRNSAVIESKIRNNAVTTDKIKDATIESNDLGDTAKPAGLASSSGNQNENLTSSHEAVRTVTIDAPANGNVQVTASWNLYGTDVVARCGITMGTTVENTHAVDTETSGSLIRVSGAAVRAYQVASGENTFNLVCYSLFGSPNIRDSSIVALYVPASY